MRGNCKEGKDNVRTGGMMTILGGLEVKRKWCFQARHVVGMDNSLADLITRCKRNTINAELKRRRPDVNWREQVMRRDEKEKYSAMLRRDTCSDLLRCRLEEFTIGCFR